MCAEIVWVYGDVCVWGYGDLVTFVSNVPIRFFLSYRAIVLRIEPSIIDFSSTCFTGPCSGNTFSQYMIWDPKDDNRAFAWV